MRIYIEWGSVLLAIIVLYLLLVSVKDVTQIIISSLIAIGIFVVVNIFGAGIPINLLTILIVALAGIPGLVLLLILHFLRVGFYTENVV